tara:strand:+ start:2400 stop:3362 length:963 start_codon:yes stop_codon:yes gene_type:complete
MKVKFLKNQINYEKKIFVAFSGGADSTALLYLANDLKKNFKYEMKAIHINHNVSINSDKWEDHCKKVCNSLGIDLLIKKATIHVQGEGFEAAARNKRYEIFTDLLDQDDQILTGHHLDDLTETIFLRLLRGTGIDGLEGIKRIRRLGKGFVVRPLLESSKKDIYKFLDEKKINFIFDESNKDIKFDRNFLRSEIINRLDSRWKNFSERIYNMTKLIISHNSIYSQMFSEKYSGLINSKISVSEIKNLSEQVQAEILRYAIKKIGIAMPNQKIIKEIIKTFFNSSPGPKSIVTWSRSDKSQPSGKIKYNNGYIYISTNEEK